MHVSDTTIQSVWYCVVAEKGQLTVEPPRAACSSGTFGDTLQPKVAKAAVSSSTISGWLPPEAAALNCYHMILNDTHFLEYYDYSWSVILKGIQCKD